MEKIEMVEKAEVENPYVQGSVTRMRVILLCSREEAWRLIGRPEGISSWFPASCEGRVAPGETLEFRWFGGDTGRFRVLEVEEGEYWEMDWSERDWKGGKVRYSLEGEKAVIFALEVTYPETAAAKASQILELAPWAFYASNLKSIAMKGPDLRNKDPAFSWKKGFIDK